MKEHGATCSADEDIKELDLQSAPSQLNTGRITDSIKKYTLA